MQVQISRFRSPAPGISCSHANPNQKFWNWNSKPPDPDCKVLVSCTRSFIFLFKSSFNHWILSLSFAGPDFWIQAARPRNSIFLCKSLSKALKPELQASSPRLQGSGQLPQELHVLMQILNQSLDLEPQLSGFRQRAAGAFSFKSNSY